MDDSNLATVFRGDVSFSSAIQGQKLRMRVVANEADVQLDF